MSNLLKTPGTAGSGEQLARGPFPVPRGGMRGPLEGIRVPPPTRMPAPPPRPAPMPAPQPAPKPMPMPQPQVQPKLQTDQKTDAPPVTREQTRQKEEQCKSEKKDCVDCPPDKGVMAIANNGKGHSMSDLSSRYQQWVTNFPFPNEWRWSNTWWDGFDKSRCTLLEAKARYAFMFFPVLKTPRPWANVREELIAPARAHSQKARPTPPVSVEWHFMERVVYEYCSEQYSDLGLTNLRAFWNPLPGTKDQEEYDELRKEEEKQMEEYYRDNPGLMA